jgi:hypothetical protein
MNGPAGAVIARTPICNENLNRPPEGSYFISTYGKDWDRCFSRQ